MKATALGDAILLESENASDMATIRLVTKTYRVRLLNAGSESGPNGWTKETFLIGPDLTKPKAPAAMPLPNSVRETLRGALEGEHARTKEQVDWWHEESSRHKRFARELEDVDAALRWLDAYGGSS